MLLILVKGEISECKQDVICCAVSRLLPYETMTLLHKFLQLDTAIDGFHQHNRHKQM